MSKRFVKIRYPEAYSVKTHGWIKNDPYIIINRDNNMMFKGNDVNEKQAWANLKTIIQEQEKAEKGLTELEIKARRAEIARVELERIENKKKINTKKLDLY
jgi:hypothetical protein